VTLPQLGHEARDPLGIFIAVAELVVDLMTSSTRIPAICGRQSCSSRRRRDGAARGQQAMMAQDRGIVVAKVAHQLWRSSRSSARPS